MQICYVLCWPLLYFISVRVFFTFFLMNSVYYYSIIGFGCSHINFMMLIFFFINIQTPKRTHFQQKIKPKFHKYKVIIIIFIQLSLLHYLSFILSFIQFSEVSKRRWFHPIVFSIDIDFIIIMQLLWRYSYTDSIKKRTRVLVVNFQH